MPLPTESQHVHGEAFMLMEYVADDGSETLLVWNSRDGVTPFILTLPSGKTATHKHWNRDIYTPDHKPCVGDWIFVDLTPERAREHAMKQAIRFWNDEGEYGQMARARHEDIDQFAAMFLEGLEEEAERGAPDFIQVTEEWT